jgi:hypothetical protein
MLAPVRAPLLLWLFLLAGCSTSSAAPSKSVDDELAKPNRPLTAGEIELLKPIFRDGIDYAKVRVINNSFPLQPANVYMTPRGHVYAPGGLWSADFSKASSGTRGVFVHEMTHVWQFANGMDLVGQGFVEFTKHRGQYEKAYPYELERGRDLTEYGMEQQASIVEDYFTIKFAHAYPHRITNRGLTDADRDALYAAVLKNFLGNARYAQALDGKQVAAQHAKASEKQKPGPEACKESEAEHGAAHMCEWRFTPKPKKP